MITIKREVKAEVMNVAANEEENEIPNPSLSSEGGTLVHGRVVLSTVDRADLFSPDLEKKLTSVICNICSQISYSFTAWRTHCLSKHASVPGYAPSLLNSGLSLNSNHFAVTLQNPYVCAKCSRTFPSQTTLEEHQVSEMRTVRLVCPQCKGQYGDLEQHMRNHAKDKMCVKCDKQWGSGSIVEHHHAQHQGFSSVIVETSVRCAGDGATMELFETVLSTEARFLASEVKPEGATSEPDDEVAEIFDHEDSIESIQKMSPDMPSKRMVDPNLRYKGSTNSGPIITNVSGSFPIYARNTPSNEIMSESERHAYNVRSYAKFRDSKIGLSRNECELCGFIPYTKNKYREKQDHLAKCHFKERIEAVLPTSRPYNCPDRECEYMGKDKQDILRHYTGKHNILKMWVDAFIKEQSGVVLEKEKEPMWQADSQKLPYKKSGEALTFQEMEVLAIENERKKHRLEKAQKHQGVGTKHHEISASYKIGSLVPETNFTISRISPTPTISDQSTVSRLTCSKSSTGSPSISLIRLNKNQQQSVKSQETLMQRAPLFVSQTRSERATKSPEHQEFEPSASRLLKTFADTVSPVSPPKESQKATRMANGISMYKDQTSTANGILDSTNAKHACINCSMSFPSMQALKLHMEVCQEGDENEVIHTGNSSLHEPPKKKTKRPPPALIPL